MKELEGSRSQSNDSEQEGSGGHACQAGRGLTCHSGHPVALVS